MGQPTEGDRILAAALIEDAIAHESGAFGRIATRYDDIYGELLPIQDLGVRRFVIAFHFWDAWCDARNHEWRYYSGIAAADWPRLARHIAENLWRGEDNKRHHGPSEFLAGGFSSSAGQILGLGAESMEAICVATG